MSIAVRTSVIPQGTTVRVAKESRIGAGQQSWTLTTSADAVLTSLYVDSTAGDLDVKIYAQTEEGKDLLLVSFPTVSAPTTELLLKKAAQVINQVRIDATWTGDVEFQIYARGVSSAESSVKILGSGNASATQKNVLTSVTSIIPASLTDRTGLILKNNNGLGGASIYIGFAPSEATLLNGYPLSAQESIGLDLSSGVEIYGISTAGTTDVRILQGGG